MSSIRQRRKWEILAVALTGIGKIVFMNFLDWRLGFIICVSLFWFSYVIYRAQQDKQILDYWGLSLKNFRSSFLELLPVATACIAIFFLIGYWQGSSVLDWTILPILLLYPIWGILQQFLVLGIFGKSLKDIQAGKWDEKVVILLTALLFGLVHYPFPLLIGATFVLALVYTTLFFRERNLLVLGIYHGWLAAFFFYIVLGRNSWLEVFG